MGDGMSRKKRCRNWTIEDLKSEASKFHKVKDFKEGNPSAYRAAIKRQILKDLCATMDPNLYNVPWTKEGLKKEALKYKTRGEFKKKHEGAYVTARKLKIMEEICEHMPPSATKPYTKAQIKKEAKKFTTRRRFKLGSKMYKSALKKGSFFMDKICAHMKKSKGTSIEEEKILAFVKQHFPDAVKKVFKNENVNFRQSKYELDIYIPSLKKGIEYDGSYWHSDEVLAKSKKITIEEAKRYHEEKDGFFASIGIEVLHIKEKHWTSTGNPWDERKILSFLGLENMPPAHKYFRYIWAQNPNEDGEF